MYITYNYTIITYNYNIIIGINSDNNNVKIIIPYCSCTQRNPEFSFQKHVPVTMPGYMNTK